MKNWKEILKLLIAVLTAIAGTLGVVSCMSGGCAMVARIITRVARAIGLILLGLVLVGVPTLVCESSELP